MEEKWQDSLAFSLAGVGGEGKDIPRLARDDVRSSRSVFAVTIGWLLALVLHSGLAAVVSRPGNADHAIPLLDIFLVRSAVARILGHFRIGTG
jgi:hypothetical protein